MVAVPVYPPDPGRLRRTLPRLQNIVADAQAHFMLTTSNILAMAEMLFRLAPELQEKQWVGTDELAPGIEDRWVHPGTTPETLAFLQYTSGSTGTPKGVMVTHGNLLVQGSIIAEASAHNPERCVVGWLPLYHDMGLIGTVLQPVVLGSPGILMSPLHFLQRPIRWLAAISHYRAESSPAPNFAYGLCVSKILPEERAELDLSCWKFALTGAEPVRAETIDRFVAAFAACGFRREAFYHNSALLPPNRSK